MFPSHRDELPRASPFTGQGGIVVVVTRWVLLLNYNTAGLCLEHLTRFAQVEDLGVLIVDNCSSEDDRARLEEGIHRAKGEAVSADATDVDSQLRSAMLAGRRAVLLRCPVNLGYGGGNNAGLRLLLAIHGDALRVLITNPDVELTPAAARSLFDDDADVSGPAVHEAYIGGLRAHEPAHDYSTGFADVTRWSRAESTGPWLSGCCLKMTGSALRRFGLLPEETFLYDEETFFFARVRKAGGVPVYRGDVVVTHAGSVSTGGKKSFHYFYYIFRNRWLFYQRVGKKLFGGRWRFYVLYFDWVLGAGRSALRKRNLEGVRGILTGMGHGMLGIDGRHRGRR
jgi:GT2 family glycosyltransferase